jgi:hypothetical protein
MFALRLILGILAAASLLPGQARPSRAAFYEPPQLFVMTGFIANTTSGTWGTDFIVPGQWTPEKQRAALAAWNRGLGRAYDADRTVKAFKEAGATGLIFYDKWHDGLVPHATQLTNYRTERDLVGPTIAAARKHGMKIVIYYSVGFDYNPDPRFLDWACRDPQGKPMGRPFPSDWMSFHSPYRRYVIDHLVEILKLYGRLDGLWLDIFSQPPELSRDNYTRQAFQARYGKPIEQATPSEAADFLIQTRRDFLLDIRKSVSAVQPDIALTFNGAGMADIAAPKSAAQVDALADFFSMEGHRLDAIERGARAGHNMDRPFEVGMLINSSWYVPMEDQAPPPAMSADEAIVSAAAAWTQGANVYAAMTPGHSGLFDEAGDLRVLRAMGDWLRNHKPFLKDSSPYADVAIVQGNPSADLTAPPSLESLWANWHRRTAPVSARPGEPADRALRRAGYFTELTGTAFPRAKVNWRQFRLLVIPENAVLDDALSAEIRDHVSAGGALLAVGHAGLFDPMGKRRADFALADVFGVRYSGELPGYKQFAPLPGSGVASRLRLNAAAVGVKATTGKVLAVWESANQAPAVVENRFGKGRALYVSAGEIAAAEGLLQELAGRLIGPPPVQVHAHREYSCVMNRMRGADDLLLFVMNRSTGSRAYTESGLAPDPELVIGPEQVQLTLDAAAFGDIAGVELLPEAAPLRFSRRSGSVQVEVNASPSVTVLRILRRTPHPTPERSSVRDPGTPRELSRPLRR